MNESIDTLRQEFEQDFAAISDMETWKSVRDRYLARDSGVITTALKKLRDIPKEDRPAFGQAMNRLRTFVEERLQEKFAAVRDADLASKLQKTDVTRPGFPISLGAVHPIKQLQKEIEQIFVSMGFQVFDLPEIEKDYYNFEALNIPKDHPARDAQDTFYFDQTNLLRTHCSAVQVHSMEAMKPPIRQSARARCTGGTRSMQRIRRCSTRSMSSSWKRELRWET